MFSQKDSAQRWYSKRVMVSEKAANIIMYIYVEDVNNLYDKIGDNVEIVMKPVDQWYGIREFAIQDPFGTILILAQVLA